jgi:ADP-ribose pyrophosphatase YjhB (NUDIX family)
MNFCSECGQPVIIIIPPDDDRMRHVCTVCNTVHYQNPKVVAGCIPVHGDRILLCKRAIEPRAGFWTLPAGFMELGETSLEAAVRETLEEAKARVQVLDLYAVFNLPHVNQVYMMFRSSLLDQDFGPGRESMEVKLFKESEIPWANLAFATIRQTLQFYFKDRRNGHFPLHTGDILRQENNYTYRPGPSETPGQS